MADTTPLRQIHTKLWEILTANASFAAAVPVGCRVNYSGTDRSPDLDSLAAADVPRVAIRHAGTKPWLFRTSDGSTVTLLWEVAIASGDQRHQTELEIEWWILVAMKDWSAKLSALTYNGATFVIHSRPLPVENPATLDDQQANRTIRGWSTVWRGETVLWFKTTALA